MLKYVVLLSQTELAKAFQQLIKLKAKLPFVQCYPSQPSKLPCVVLPTLFFFRLLRPLIARSSSQFTVVVKQCSPSSLICFLALSLQQFLQHQLLLSPLKRWPVVLYVLYLTLFILLILRSPLVRKSLILNSNFQFLLSSSRSFSISR